MQHATLPLISVTFDDDGCVSSYCLAEWTRSSAVAKRPRDASYH